MERQVAVKEYMTSKPKLLFVYDMADETNWKDGLWAALNLLEKDFDVYKENLSVHHSMIVEGDWDFILGWGGFGSSVDIELHKPIYKHNKKGLCLGGYGFPPTDTSFYDIIFYECEWGKAWLEGRGVRSNLKHAFGVNTDIYKPLPNVPRIWNYITVGSFSYWKRQTKIIDKKGPRIAVGAIQKDNLGESIDIVGNLILGHCGVTDEVSPETLAKMYNSSLICYIPAETVGGGERAVLEARACGIDVEIEQDNPKLKELTVSPVWDHNYYYQQLKEGILKCI